MTIRSNGLRAAVVWLLVVGALVLWLSAGTPSHAASADQIQGTVVSVQGKAISWEDNAKCGAFRADQGFASPAFTANFGSSPPGGGSLYLTGFLGCVMSNATWNVDAVASALALTNGAASIHESNLWLRAGGLQESSYPGFGDPSPAPISPECDAVLNSDCSLGSTRTVVVGAEPSPAASGFVYQYRLDVPASAPTGTYNGSVTFTASN